MYFINIYILRGFLIMSPRSQACLGLFLPLLYHKWHLTFDLLLRWQVCHLHGEEDWRPGVRAARGSAGGQTQDGADGVRLPHGPRLQETLNPVRLDH